MNTLGHLLAAVLMGAIYYLLGICGILGIGIILQGIGVSHPEDLLIWVIILWTIFCIVQALRFLRRTLKRGF